MEVDFITLGDASDKLKTPSATLRNWTDQLEEFNVHFVKRNNRNERIYYDTDLEIFAYIRDLKQEYGRKTTMKDIANMLKDMDDRFMFRSQEDAPAPVAEPSNKTADLINAEDVQRLMENQRVRALIGYMIAENTKQIRAEMLEELQNQWDKDREVLVQSIQEEVKREIAVGKELLVQEIQTLQEAELKREEVQKIQYEQVQTALKTQKEEIILQQKAFQKEQKERDDEQQKREQDEKERIEKRDIESIKLLKELLEQRKKEQQEQKEREEKERTEKESKGFFAKLFGK